MARTTQAADSAAAALKKAGENGVARLDAASKNALQPEDREVMKFLDKVRAA